jgi:hypothetical protein
MWYLLVLLPLDICFLPLAAARFPCFLPFLTIVLIVHLLYFGSYIDRDVGEKANAWDVEENCGWQEEPKPMTVKPRQTQSNQRSLL